MGGDYKTVDRKDMGRVIEQSVEKSTAVAVSYLLCLSSRKEHEHATVVYFSTLVGSFIPGRVVDIHALYFARFARFPRADETHAKRTHNTDVYVFP